jgi:hypothetical protein
VTLEEFGREAIAAYLEAEADSPDVVRFRAAMVALSEAIDNL